MNTEFDKNEFKHIGKFKGITRNKTASLSYWQDAYRRLKKNKVAMLSFGYCLFNNYVNYRPIITKTCMAIPMKVKI